jgi:hypothetical protein
MWPCRLPPVCIPFREARTSFVYPERERVNRNGWTSDGPHPQSSQCLLGRRTPARTDAGPRESLRVPGPYTGHCFYGLPSQCDTPGDAVDAAPRAVQPWVPRGLRVPGPYTGHCFYGLPSQCDTPGDAVDAAPRAVQPWVPRGFWVLGPDIRGLPAPRWPLPKGPTSRPCQGTPVGTGGRRQPTGLHRKKCAPIGEPNWFSGHPLSLYIYMHGFPVGAPYGTPEIWQSRFGPNCD